MKEYTRLEYIESDGNQWIDTGFTPNQDSKIVIDAQYSASNLVGRLIGCENLGKGTGKFRFGTGGAGKWYTGYDSYAYQQVGSVDSLRHLFTIDKNNFYVDDSLIYSYGYIQFVGYGSVYIFMIHSDSMADYAHAKVFSCQIYDNGAIVRDYIPVKNSEGVYGLYDKVEKKFYPSQGSKDFIGGAEIEYKPLSFPYGFRRRCMSVAKKGTHIKEGLDFWFDGLDNQANGVYAPSVRTWKAKSDNSNISSRQLSIKSGSYFDSNGGLIVRTLSSSSSVGASSEGWTPYYYLDTYDSLKGFTIECVVSIESENPYGSANSIWGMTYTTNSAADYRGGLFHEGELFYQYHKSSWIKLKPGYVLPLGKHIITVVLTTDSKMKYYVDGIKVGDYVSVSSGFRLAKTTHNPLSLGNYSAGDIGAMYGIFYSYKSYSRVLSDREIMDSANFAKSYYKL